MNKILTILTLLFTSLTYSQNLTLCLGQDRTVCPGQTVTINDCSNIGGGSSVGNSPYSVVNIPYTPDPFNLGTPITLSDDAISQVQNIGFSFCFFGNTYTQFYIGSNGWIGFTPGQPTSFTSTSIPSAAANVPKNCIMGPWQDWHPGTGSGGPYIRYQVLGTAPNRRLVVSWNNCPMFSCTSTLGTFQIVLFETTNNIETRMQNKPNCPGWAGGTSVHGIHNLAGNAAVVVPGRNSTQWTTTNNAWRFTPQVVWGNTLGQTFPYNGGVLNVNPVPPGTTGYFLKSGCSSGGTGNAISDTTWLTLANPSVVVSSTNDICSQSIGTVTSTPGSGSPNPISYSWIPNIGTTAVVNNLPVGTYIVNIIDGNGCSTSDTASIINTIVPITTNFTVDSISCYGLNDGSIIAQNNQYNYNWSNGFTGNTVIDLSPGNYTVTYNLGNCLNSTSFNLTQPDSIFIQSITNDTIICLGQTLNVDVLTNIVGNYNWSNNLFGQNISFNPNSTQNLCVTVENQCNVNDTDTECLNITVDELVGSFYFSQNPINVETTQISLIGSGGDNYQWSSIFTNSNYISTGSVNEYTATLNEMSGDFIFSMIVTNSLGCVDTVSNVLTINESYNIFIPNSFTPDGNEFNQTWSPVLSKVYDINDYSISIFNRWGEVIWQSKDLSIGWDGTFNNKYVQSGVYIWKLKVGILGNDDIVEMSGYINVLK
jgi:gliding motility-associated-like protein